MSRFFLAATMAAVAFGQACPKGCWLGQWPSGRMECICPESKDPGKKEDKKEKENEKGEKEEKKEKKEKEKN